MTSVFAFLNFAYSLASHFQICQVSRNFRESSEIVHDLQVSRPCLGPFASRGAVGACHDGLPRQFSPLLPVVCHGLSLSERFAGPLRDVVNPALFRPAPSSTAFECSLYIVVSLWLARPILSRAHTISVFAALQLPDFRTVLFAL